MGYKKSIYKGVDVIGKARNQQEQKAISPQRQRERTVVAEPEGAEAAELHPRREQKETQAFALLALPLPLPVAVSVEPRSPWGLAGVRWVRFQWLVRASC